MNLRHMKLHLCLAAIGLMAAPSGAFGAILSGDVADGVVKGPRNAAPSDGDAGTGAATVNGHTLKVGGTGSNDNTGGRAAVYVFQLPNFGAVANPFTTASLSFTVEQIASTPANGDLYGLGSRAAATVLQTDYFLGDLDATDATRLQDNILNSSSTEFTGVTTDATGSAALAAYLNVQYAGGAGAGQYAFLRLSPDAELANARGYEVYTANEDVEANRPFITYTAVPEPSSLALLGLAGIVGLAFRRRVC